MSMLSFFISHTHSYRCSHFFFFFLEFNQFTPPFMVIYLMYIIETFVCQDKIITLKNKSHNEKRMKPFRLAGLVNQISVSQSKHDHLSSWMRKRASIWSTVFRAALLECLRVRKRNGERPSTLPGNWKRRVGDERPQLTLTHSARPSVQREALWPKFTLPHPHRHLFSLLGKHLEKYKSEKNSTSLSTSCNISEAQIASAL